MPLVQRLEIKERPRNSKSSRLETMQPYFAQGKFYIRKEMIELRDELLLYPRGKHDDLLDGLFYANKGIYSPFHKDSDRDNEKKEQFINKFSNDSWMTV